MWRLRCCALVQPCNDRVGEALTSNLQAQVVMWQSCTDNLLAALHSACSKASEAQSNSLLHPGMPFVNRLAQHAWHDLLCSRPVRTHHGGGLLEGLDGISEQRIVGIHQQLPQLCKRRLCCCITTADEQLTDGREPRRHQAQAAQAATQPSLRAMMLCALKGCHLGWNSKFNSGKSNRIL